MAEQSRYSIIVDTATEAAERSLGNLGGVVKGLGAAVAAAFTAGAIKDFFKSSIEEGIKAEDGYRRLGAAVHNTGADFKALKPELDRTVDAVQRLSNRTDDDLRAALTKLISTTGNVAGSMQNLGLVADVAAERQIDLEAAAVLVGKTMNGNLTPLMKAYGVQVKDAADGIALLHERTDGFAKTATQGLGGALKNLSIQWGEFKEAVGLALIGSGDLTDGTHRLADALIRLQGFIKDNSAEIGGFVTKLIDAGEAIAKVGTWIVNHTPNWLTASRAVKALGGAHEETAQSVGTAEAAMTSAVLVNAALRTAKVKEETTTTTATRDKASKEQERIAREAAKTLSDVQEELAVRVKMLEEGWTEAQAKEWVKRQKALGESLGVQVKTLKDGYDQIDRANLLLKAGFDQLIPTVKRTESTLGELTTSGTLPTSNAVQQLADKLGITTEEAEKLLRKGGAVKLSFEDGGRAAIGMAQGLGILNDQAAAALQNVLSLGESLGKISTEGLGAGLPGLIGGLTGVLATILGGDRERMEIARRAAAATERLADVNGELLALNTPGRVYAGAERFFANENLGQFTVNGRANLVKALGKYGLSLSEFEAAAKDLGYDIFNSAGGVSFAGLSGFKGGLGETQFSAFGDTFKDQLRRIGIGKDIGAITGGDELGQVLGAVGIGGPNAILQALSGLDLSTASGASSATANLRELFTNIGTLSGSDFGGLTGPEFLDAIQRIIGLLTDDVTDLGGVLVPSSIGVPGAPVVPVVFDTIAEQGSTQIDVLTSMDAKLGELVEGQRQGGGAAVGYVPTQLADALDEEFAKRYRLRQLAAGRVEL